MRLLAPPTALLLLAAPAAAAPYGPPDTQSCVSHVAAVGTGTVFGAGDCGKGIAVGRRDPGGTWRITGAYWPAELRVEDVAADGAATFVVLSRGESGRKTFSIGKLPHGSSTLSALTTLGATQEATDGASVVAAGGRWAAAWTETSPAADGRPAASRVRVRGPLIGGVPRSVADGPSMPGEAALALSPEDVHVLFTETASDGARVLRQARVTVGGGHVSSATRFGPAAGAPAALPDAVVSGGTLVVGWSRAGAPAVAIGGTRRDLPHRGTVTELTVAASGGTAFLTTAEMFGYAGGSTQRVYARDVTRAGEVSRVELSAAAGRANPNVEVHLHSATAARGRSTVSTSIGIVSQR